MSTIDQHQPSAVASDNMPPTPRGYFMSTQDPGIPPIEPGTTTFLAKTIIASALAGGTFGAASGFSRNLDPFAVAFHTGCKWVAVGAGFFGTREILVSPALVYLQATHAHARRYKALVNSGNGVLDVEEPSLADLRTDRVLDSGLAAAFAFGLWTGAFRGPKLIPRAAFTAALAASLGQYAVNFARVSRIELLSDRDRSSTQAVPSTAPTPSAPGLTEQLRQATRDPGHTMDVKGDETIPGRILGMMSYIAPIKKINQQEHLEKLRRQRELLDQRLRDIEAEEDRLFELVQKHEAGAESRQGEHVV